AVAQIEAALLWWSRNRPASRGLLANEVDRALSLIEHVPRAGRRTASKLFRDVRRLLLRRSGYHLYYPGPRSTAGRPRRVLPSRSSATDQPAAMTPWPSEPDSGLTTSMSADVCRRRSRADHRPTARRELMAHCPVRQRADLSARLTASLLR